MPLVILLLGVVSAQPWLQPPSTKLHFRQQSNDPSHVLERIQAALGLPTGRQSQAFNLASSGSAQPPSGFGFPRQDQLARPQPHESRPQTGFQESQGKKLPTFRPEFKNGLLTNDVYEALKIPVTAFVKSSDKFMAGDSFQNTVQAEIINRPDEQSSLEKIINNIDQNSIDYEYDIESTTELPIWYFSPHVVAINEWPQFLNPAFSSNIQPLTVQSQPKAVVLDLNPQLLSPTLLHNIIGVGLNPSVLNLNIHPQLLSPTIRTRILTANVQPSLLRENFQPNILSPQISFDGAYLEASPKILSQDIAPCLLGPKIHMALLKALFAPQVVVSEISPSLLCPEVNLQLLKASYTPEVVKHSLSPSQLSPSVDVSLIEF